MRKWSLLHIARLAAASVLIAANALVFASPASAQATGGSVIDQGMLIERDVLIPMSDGIQLRANVFRPPGEGKYPVIMTLSTYGKDIHFEDLYKAAWDELLVYNPEMCKGSSCKYVRWETPDPERWTPRGYIVIAVDGRGSGKSPGYLDAFSPQETRDYYEAIEWAGTQPWSNGRVGLTGVSYYAMKQWQVAALRPPHLAAITPWEGAFDMYRDFTRQGGILGDGILSAVWRFLVNAQYGNGKTPLRERETGERVTGGAALSEELLAGARNDLIAAALDHPLDDAWWQARTADPSRIETPVFSAGNLGGIGLHLRGNVEGYLKAASHQKWLSLHGGTHFETYYQPQWVEVQRRFFDHFLKGLDNGWTDTPPVQVTVRHPNGDRLRYENEWPLARTHWTKFYLKAAAREIDQKASGKPEAISFQASDEGVTFTTAPFPREMEFTGPVAARLWVSSSTTDMDIFATLRAFGPDGKEVTFRGANDPAAPVSQGWLRVSQRKIDHARSRTASPRHAHDESQKLTPGQVYPVDVEIWPTSIVIPKGFRLALTIAGRDFERSGVLLHRNAQDRPPGEFGGVSTLSTGGEHESYLLLPLIPAGSGSRP